MSWRATSYVKRLRCHADGTPLTAREKLILFVVADYYDDRRGCAWPGFSVLSEEALTSRRHLGTLLEQIEGHGTLAIERSDGRSNSYRLPKLAKTREASSLETREATSLPANKTREISTSQLGKSVPQTREIATSLEGTEGTERKRGQKNRPLAALAVGVLSDLTARRNHVTEEFSIEVYEALLKFEQYRKKIRKPLTEHAVELILKKLRQFQAEGMNPIEVLEQSEINGWAGVFPVRKERGREQPKSFHERRSEKSAEAINKVLGRIAEASGGVQRALPPARK